MLIRMDVEEKPNNVNGVKSSTGKTEKAFDPSRKFRRSAPSFILLTVLPYMVSSLRNFILVQFCAYF